jgi:exopolysaccharide biosynthesis polyprenyl glycosylphosphotransferase
MDGTAGGVAQAARAATETAIPSRSANGNGNGHTDAASTVTALLPMGHQRAERERLLEYEQIVAAERPARSARDTARRRLLVGADAIAVAMALSLAGFAASPAHPRSQLLVAIPLWVLLNKVLGLYDWDSAVIDKWTFHELPRLTQSVLIATAVLFVAGPTAGLHLDRGAAPQFAALALAAMWAGRSIVRSLVLRHFGPERSLIIGSGEVAGLIARKLRAHPSYGTTAVGYVDGGAAEHPSEPSILGDLGSLHRICRELEIERIIIAFSRLNHEHILDAVRAGTALGIKVTVAPRLFEVLGPSVVLDRVEGMSMLSLRGSPRTPSSLALKRTIDVAGAGIGLLTIAPLLALIAVLIKLDSRGPVIFSQVRIGRGNRPFRIHKFRTMVQDADRLKAEILHLNEVEFPLIKIPEDRDPRLTRVGRILRRTALDELPQLWNVLRGEMSLVGPRPLEPQDDAEVIGWHRARLELTPGLTGPWQALGRHAIPFHEMLTLDYLYVADWSLWHDIRLLIRTFQSLVRPS